LARILGFYESPDFAQLQLRNCAKSGEYGWQFTLRSLIPAVPA